MECGRVLVWVCFCVVIPHVYPVDDHWSSRPPFTMLPDCKKMQNVGCCTGAAASWDANPELIDKHKQSAEYSERLFRILEATHVNETFETWKPQWDLVANAQNALVGDLYDTCITINRTRRTSWEMCWGTRYLLNVPGITSAGPDRELILPPIGLCMPSNVNGVGCSVKTMKLLMQNFGVPAEEFDIPMCSTVPALQKRDTMCLTNIQNLTCNANPPADWNNKIATPSGIAQFIDQQESDLEYLYKISTNAEWNFETDETDENEEEMLHKTERLDIATQDALRNVLDRLDLLGKDYKLDAISERKLKLLKVQGGGIPKQASQVTKLKKTIATMTNIYDTTQVDGLDLDPGIEEKITSGAKSGDVESLNYFWKEWHNKVGRDVGSLFGDYVELLNQGAKDTGFKDASELWQAPYDIRDFESVVDELWEELQPMYEQFHCYVRSKLREKYPDNEELHKYSTLPANMMGNMWAQDWSALYDIVQPYPAVEKVEITGALQNKTAEEMHRMSEDFYVSLGWDKLPDSFWTKSMLKRPTDRKVQCHGSAWDFTNDDLRIKMCTKPTQEDFFTAHHEQGHIYYFHYYKDLTYLFRDGANPGFHEAIGDTTTLSLTPQHLKALALLKSDNETVDATTAEDLEYKRLINFQMMKALEKIAFLPFGLLIDKWRWSIFSGYTEKYNWNNKWWKLRVKYQGVHPPVDRSCTDFDGGAKAHVTFDVPYIRYFISHVLQFQFHNAMCKESSQNDIHKCSIYKHTSVGTQFQNMLSKGNLNHWQHTIQEFLGTQMSSEGIVEYFKPLTEWLKEQNKGQKCGWDPKIIPHIPKTCAPHTRRTPTDEDQDDQLIGGIDFGEWDDGESSESSEDDDDDEDDTDDQDEDDSESKIADPITMTHDQYVSTHPGHKDRGLFDFGLGKNAVAFLVVTSVVIVVVAAAMFVGFLKWLKRENTRLVDEDDTVQFSVPVEQSNRSA